MTGSSPTPFPIIRHPIRELTYNIRHMLEEQAEEREWGLTLGDTDLRLMELWAKTCVFAERQGVTRIGVRIQMLEDTKGKIEAAIVVTGCVAASNLALLAAHGTQRQEQNTPLSQRKVAKRKARPSFGRWCPPTSDLPMPFFAD